MQTAKAHIAISVAVFSIVMLLYSPLCSLSCAISNCALSKAVTSKSSEQPGHCHGSPESEEESSMPGQDPSAPDAPEDSSACPFHVEAAATLPSTANLSADLNNLLQPVPADPQAIAIFYFDHRGEMRAEEAPFRSPPASPRKTVLRI
jgi:hypothetical protein